MRLRVLLLSFAVIGLAFGFAGCFKAHSRSSTSTDTILSESDWGGFTTGDEDASFAAESNALPYGEDEGEEEAEPGIEEDENLAALENTPTRRVYILRVEWGQLHFNPDCPIVTDWSGSLAVERGAVRMLRKIRFERHDHILRPRTSINEIAWVSYTKPHHDGLLLKIIVPPAEDGVEDPTVTFTAGEYTRTFTLAELEDLRSVEEVDDAGNRIAFNAFRARLPEYLDGIFAGRWLDREFHGKWIARDGHVVGRMVGRYGRDDDGNRVLFGKFVDCDGKFLGLLKGVWTPGPFGFGGVFSGKLYDADKNPYGKFGGEYVKALRPDGGFFRGAWHEFDEE